MHHIFKIYSSVHGHLNCFYMLTTVNNAAMNIGMQILLRDSNFSSFKHIPRVGILDNMAVLFVK